jgi:branched-chain amino acid transport system permease protein
MPEAVHRRGVAATLPAIAAPGPLLAALLLLALILAPFGLGRFWLALLVNILFWTYLSGAWNIVGGIAGQFSLGHAAFFGLGAYSSALLYVHFGLSPWLGMLVGAVLSAGLAAFLGAVTFRFRLAGAYFAIGTLAFSEIFRTLVGALPYFGQGSGTAIPLSKTPGWSVLQFQEPRVFYYLFLAPAVAMVALTWSILRSRFGYRLACIRDSEEVARSVGIDVDRQKLLAFVLSAALAAPAGTLYSQYLMFVEPNTYLSLGTAIQIVLPAMLGGAGTMFGPLCGAVLLSAASEIFNLLGVQPGISLLAYGIVLMLVAGFLNQGLAPFLLSRLAPRKASRC